MLFVGVASAQVADYKLNVQNFCELTVVDGIGVDYCCSTDSAGWAVFSCEPATASRIMFSNKEEVLTIQTDADEKAITNLPRIKVYSVSLRKVENSGDSTVCIHVTTPVKSFKAKQIGNGMLDIHGLDAGNVDASIMAGCGKLYIEGKTNKVTFKNVSSGPIKGSGLVASEVKCLMLGNGDIECKASDKLSIFGAGSGMVVYHSDPAKIVNRGIGVKAVRRQESDITSL